MQNYSSTTEYISSFEPKIQKILKKIRTTIKKSFPKAEEKIAYGMPSIYVGKKRVYFAAAKTHIGLYPGPAIISKFKKELAPYDTSKGTIRFPLDDKEIPYPLITKIVKAILS